jgi:hypothetical protein
MPLEITGTGSIEWQKEYGAPESGPALSVEPSSDGGFLVAAPYLSGNQDYWVLKLDAGGNVSWQKRYGGPNWDYPTSLLPVAGGGCLVAGNSMSFTAGAWDHWILRLNASGAIEWQKRYGGSSLEAVRAIRPAALGGYLVGGDAMPGSSPTRAASSPSSPRPGPARWPATRSVPRERARRSGLRRRWT